MRRGTLPKTEYIKTLIQEESAYQQFLTEYNLPDSAGFKVYYLMISLVF
ncbi:hypothetical protein QUB80_00300 [Chlorogloeopsis sp. ULAP01]|nr:hypothetical protein [Chlorogloeopsis sp. ULAP01]MDM9379148.1 hypothetical protein [Chlorogloeopsis sp. ULAP01]